MKGLGTGVKSRKRKPYVGWFARCGRLKKRTRSSFRRDIPDDLLPEILKRLPLKSLCRFKCVSKSWRSTIITNFLQSERQYLVCEHYNSRPLIFDDNSESSWVVNLYSINGHGLTTPICTPLPLDYSAIRTRYCNGLLCFRDWDRGFFCILNPLTREKICLPENQKQRYLEFGFHPLTNKYKVWGWVNFPHCEIYTLGTTSWRPVTSLPVDGCGRFSTSCFCFNGTFYTYTTTNMIISFDLGSESWGAIQGPKRVTNVSDKKGSKVLFLFELEGCLCLADVHHWKNVLDLWMLKDLSNDSSWVLMATVTESPIGNCMSWTEPYPTRTGEIVLAVDEHRTFYLYSFITQQYDTMEVVALASNSFVTNYVENLVILKDL